ncbi:MAG: iron ABC transporter permease, partial [Rubrivivax sp.]
MSGGDRPRSAAAATAGSAAPRGWLLLGAAAFVLLPWYLPQNLTLWQSLAAVFGSGEGGSGLVQALQRPWLWAAAAALLLASTA